MMDREGIVVGEACKVQQHLLVILRILAIQLPWTPLLHDSEKFKFVMSLEDELLNQSSGNLLFDGTNAIVLIDGLHAMAGLLASVILVTILIRQVLNLNKDQVVQLHQLHAGEWLDIHEGLACRKFEWALVLHVLFVIEDAIPHRLGCLFISLLLAHWGGVVHVRVTEV